MARTLDEVLGTDPSIVDPQLLVEGWDYNAPTRLAELASGSDGTYLALANLIVDTIAEERPDAQRVIDVGCGLGFLARR